MVFNAPYIGVSPSGKATDFDSVMRWFESSYPSCCQACLAFFMAAGRPSCVVDPQYPGKRSGNIGSDGRIFCVQDSTVEKGGLFLLPHQDAGRKLESAILSSERFAPAAPPWASAGLVRNGKYTPCSPHTFFLILPD